MKHYKSVRILSNFQNQVPLRKFKSSIQDFLTTVLVFKPHIFSRDSLVAFDSYLSEQVRNTRIVDLTIKTIWVPFTWRVLLVLWDFYNLGKRVATWSSRCALKSLCRHTCYVGAVCLFFCCCFLNTDKKKTDVIFIKNVGHIFWQIFQLWRFRLVSRW